MSESNPKVTTKRCPKCGNTKLLLLRTMNMKCCTNCHTDIPWFLDEGQPAIGYKNGTTKTNNT